MSSPGRHGQSGSPSGDLIAAAPSDDSSLGTGAAAAASSALAAAAASTSSADTPSTGAGPSDPPASLEEASRPHNLGDSAALNVLFPHLLSNIRLSRPSSSSASGGGPAPSLTGSVSAAGVPLLGFDDRSDWELGLVQALPNGAPEPHRPGGGAGSPAERAMRLSHPLLARLSPSSSTTAATPPPTTVVNGARTDGGSSPSVEAPSSSDAFPRTVRRAYQLSPDTRRWGRIIDHGELALPLAADSGSPMDIDAILGGGSYGGDGPSDADEGSDPSDDDEDEELDINWHADPLWRGETVPQQQQQRAGYSSSQLRRPGGAARSQPGQLSAGGNGEAWMEAVWSVPSIHDDEHPLHVNRPTGSLAFGSAISGDELGRSSVAAPRGQSQQRAMMRRLQDRRERQATPAAVWVAGKGKTAAGKDLPDGLPAYLRRHPHLHDVQPADADLPTHFSPTDHSPLLAVSTSGFRASYVPLRSRNDRDAASVRANLPIPTSVGLFYFEIEIVDAGQRGYIGVGLSGRAVNLGRLPGWERSSWGYHGDDGMVFGEKGQGREFGPGFTTGDVIGCGLDVGQGAVFYTKNGILLGHVFQGLNCEGLYPTIGLRTPREEVRANFGQFPFRFDIDGYFADRQRAVLSSVLAAPARPAGSSSLAPPAGRLSEDDRARLTQLRSELRVERTAAEDGRADWNALSGLQRAVWDLLDKSEPAFNPEPASTAAAAALGPTDAGAGATDGKATGKGGRSKAISGKSSEQKGKKASTKPSPAESAAAGAEGPDAIRALVGEYLSHQGYAATLDAFRRNLTPAAPEGAAPLAERSANTVLDRQFRRTIVRGRLDSAIGMLEKRYPSVLAGGAGFALRCAKLVRLIVDASGPSPKPEPGASRNGSTSNGRGEPVTRVKKRKASGSADSSVDGASLPPGKAFRSSAHPDSSPSTSPPVQLSTTLPRVAVASDPVVDDATDRILAYARSLSPLARPSLSPDSSAAPNAREELLNACIGLLAFARLPRTPTASEIGEKCLGAWRLGTAEGLVELADQIEERILDAEDVDREPSLEAVLKHTLAVHEQMGVSNLGVAAFVDVAGHLIP